VTAKQNGGKQRWTIGQVIRKKKSDDWWKRGVGSLGGRRMSVFLALRVSEREQLYRRLGLIAWLWTREPGLVGRGFLIYAEGVNLFEMNGCTVGNSVVHRGS
jgi:hypothetical protein